MSGERGVGDRLVSQGQPQRPRCVEVAELERPVPGRRRELRRARQLRRRSRARSPAASASLPRGVQAAHEAVRGEHGQARVLERDEAHQHVAVLALAADLLGVDARRLVAVVAVGDQQLDVARAPPAPRRSPSASATRHSRCTVPSASLTSPHGLLGGCVARARPTPLRVGSE